MGVAQNQRARVTQVLVLVLLRNPCSDDPFVFHVWSPTCRCFSIRELTNAHARVVSKRYGCNKRERNCPRRHHAFAGLTSTIFLNVLLCIAAALDQYESGPYESRTTPHHYV